MTETLNHIHEEIESNDVASIISTASSELDPIQEIAFQFGVDFIEYSDFEDIQPIKTEAKAVVKRAIWKEQSQEVALKQIIGSDDEEIHGKLETEIIRALQNLDHDNLMQFYGVTQDIESNSCMTVLQLAKSGNLREYMTANPGSPWINRLRIARDIAHGLRRLHKTGVIHGDLHAKNIFIDDGKAFIRAPRMIAYDDESTSNYNESPEVVPYVDPRLMAEMSFRPDQCSDIYSLGVLLWEISSQRPPFENYENHVRLTVDIMAKKIRENPVSGIPEDYVKLYEDCWQHDSALRPTIDEVCDKMEEFLKDDPLSAHLRRSKLTGSDEELFTFEEEPLSQQLPVKTGNGNTDLSETENGNTDLSETGNGNTDLSETENGNTDLSETENGNPDLSKTENGNIDLSKTENGNIDLSKTENGNIDLSNGNREVKKQNGSVRRQSNADNMIKKQARRSSKLFKVFKLDVQKTKARFVHAWSKMSCSGRGNVYDGPDNEK